MTHESIDLASVDTSADFLRTRVGWVTRYPSRVIDLLGGILSAGASIVGNGLVAVLALVGIGAGFVHHEYARRRAHKAEILSNADAAIAAVKAAMHPVTFVNHPWSLDDDERAELSKDLERRAAHEVAESSGAAMVALSHASTLAPELNVYVDEGPRYILERRDQLAERLRCIRSEKRL